MDADNARLATSILCGVAVTCQYATDRQSDTARRLVHRLVEQAWSGRAVLAAAAATGIFGSPPLFRRQELAPCSAGGFSRIQPATTVFFSHAKSAQPPANQPANSIFLSREISQPASLGVRHQRPLRRGPRHEVHLICHLPHRPTSPPAPSSTRRPPHLAWLPPVPSPSASTTS